jgi:hypothetical protein
MNDSLKKKNISKSGLLLKNILDISNVGQRECSQNMDEHDQYLRNYIYTEKEIKLGRNFSYNFLAAIYHSLSINRKSTRANEEFDKIIQDKNNLNLGLENTLLIPAIERHILALSKLRTSIFDESQEIIFDNYVQQIFPEEFREYDEFLRNMDHQREGFKNIENVRLVYYEPKEAANRLKGMKNRTDKDNTDLTSFSPTDENFKKFKKFEKRAESINNFYSVCEKRRENYLPSFYSPTDFKEAEMPYFNKGNFLIKRSAINSLKKENIIGGEVVIKSGQFSFEPVVKKEEKQKKSWFFGKQKEKEKQIEIELKKEVAEIELQKVKFETELAAEINKVQEETSKTLKLHEDLLKKNREIDQENKELKKELMIFKNIVKKNYSLDLNKEKENEQKKLIEQGRDVRKLSAKGKKISLFDIDKLINKHGNTKIIREFVNSLGFGSILDEPENEKIPGLFEENKEIKTFLKKEEKKRA